MGRRLFGNMLHILAIFFCVFSFNKHMKQMFKTYLLLFYLPPQMEQDWWTTT